MTHRWLVLAGILPALSCRPEAVIVSARPAALGRGADEIDALVTLTAPPARFAAHEPWFSVEECEIAFERADGARKMRVLAVTDRGRHVAAYFPELSVLDLVAHDPARAPRVLDLPSRYDERTALDVRISTVLWYDIPGAAGERHSFEFSGGGRTITLTERQEWRARRNAMSVHTFTISCDPVLGYVVDADCRLQTDDRDSILRARGLVEFVNLLCRDVANVWPGRWRFDMTVYSRVAPAAPRAGPSGSAPASGGGDRNAAEAGVTEGFAGWRNNPVAARLSDEIEGGLRVRDGGIVAFLAGEDGWGPALSRRGGYGFRLATGEVWQEQHNLVAFPTRQDADGLFRLSPRFRLAFLPPEVAARVLDKTRIEDFAGRSEPMIRLGVLENFEDQPLPLTAPVRGAWADSFTISEAEAHSGRKSLLVAGGPAVPDGATPEGLPWTPRIPLDPGMTYLVEAWVKAVGGGTEAFILADIHDGPPEEAARIAGHRSRPVASGGGWRQAALSFTAPRTAAFVDLRLVVTGPGRAWFDDFHMRPLPRPGAPSQPSPPPRPRPQGHPAEF